MSLRAGHLRRAHATIRSASCVSIDASMRMRIARRYVRDCRTTRRASRGPIGAIQNSVAQAPMRRGRAATSSPRSRASAGHARGTWMGSASRAVSPTAPCPAPDRSSWDSAASSSTSSSDDSRSSRHDGAVRSPGIRRMCPCSPRSTACLDRPVRDAVLRQVLDDEPRDSERRIPVLRPGVRSYDQLPMAIAPLSLLPVDVRPYLGAQLHERRALRCGEVRCGGAGSPDGRVAAADRCRSRSLGRSVRCMSPPVSSR